MDVLTHSYTPQALVGLETTGQQTGQEAHGEAGHKAAHGQHSLKKCLFSPLGFVHKQFSSV